MLTTTSLLGRVRLKIPGFVMLLGMVLLAAGCEKQKQTVGPAAPPEVLVTAVVQKDVPISREWVAQLDGSANVDIRARVQGYLVSQDYYEGSIVKKGDVLFEIDPRPFDASLAQAKADLAKAEAASVKAALDEKRQVQLFASKAVSEADRDAAVQNSASARASVESAKASVQQAQLNRDFCKITSPVDGIAGNAKPGVGDLVSTSGTELTTVSTVDPINAKFQLSEQEYMKVAERVNEVISSGTGTVNDSATSLELVLADGSVHPHKGRYTKMNRQVDAKTGTIEICATFPNPGNILRPGQFARLRSTGKARPGTLLVPQRAVNELQGSYQVAVVSDGKADIRPVKVGERVGSLWIIEEGLKPGEQVVVEGFQKVREGVPVSAKPWGAPAAK